MPIKRDYMFLEAVFSSFKHIMLRDSVTVFFFFLSFNWGTRGKEQVQHLWGLISFTGWVLTFLNYSIQRLFTPSQNGGAHNIKVRVLRDLVSRGQWRKTHGQKLRDQEWLWEQNGQELPGMLRTTNEHDSGGARRSLTVRSCDLNTGRGTSGAEVREKSRLEKQIEQKNEKDGETNSAIMKCGKKT